MQQQYLFLVTVDFFGRPYSTVYDSSATFKGTATRDWDPLFVGDNGSIFNVSLFYLLYTGVQIILYCYDSSNVFVAVAERILIYYERVDFYLYSTLGHTSLPHTKFFAHGLKSCWSV